MTLQDLNDHVATQLSPMLAESMRKEYRRGKVIGAIIGSVSTAISIVGVAVIMYVLGV